MDEATVEMIVEESNADSSRTIEKTTYTPKEIQKILQISEPTTYALIKKNLFLSKRVGQHIRISKKSFDEWLDGRN